MVDNTINIPKSYTLEFLDLWPRENDFFLNLVH